MNKVLQQQEVTDDPTPPQVEAEISGDTQQQDVTTDKPDTEVKDDEAQDETKDETKDDMPHDKMDQNLPAEQLATELAAAFTQQEVGQGDNSELDDFFGTGMSLSSEATKFPALEIVDFESDEDGQRKETFAEVIVGDGQPGDSVVDEGEEGQGQTGEGHSGEGDGGDLGKFVIDQGRMFSVSVL